MASKAKRLRQKLVREGKMDPALKRGSWHGVNPVERKPERPMIEQRRKQEKHRGRQIRGNEFDVFFFSAFTLMKMRIHKNRSTSRI